MRAVDTNVLVRALTQDDPAQAKRALAFMSAHQVFVPVTVVLELEWVLRSRYGFAPAVIAQALGKIASLENTVIGEHAAVVAATENLRAVGTSRMPCTMPSPRAATTSRRLTRHWRSVPSATL